MSDRLELDSTLVEALRRRQDTLPGSEIAPDEDAVSLYGGLGVGFLLTFDGRILEEDWFDKSVAEVRDPQRIMMALVLGVRQIPELRRLIPQRTPSASDCPLCAGSGWCDLAGKKHVHVCPTCGGLGWLAPSAVAGKDAS